ncbi:hypothetical protein [Bacteroides sp.]
MGKNYKRELEDIAKTIEWAKKQSVQRISDFLQEKTYLPILFIASGGSFSACTFAEFLAVRNGQMAKSLTPYLFSESAHADLPAKILLISANGKNNDINRAFERALSHVDIKVGGLVTRVNSVLAKQFEKAGNLNLFEYAIPSKHDGFLATNSLIAFYLLLYRAYGYNDLNRLKSKPDEDFLYQAELFVNQLKRIDTSSFSRYTAFMHKMEGVDSFFILYSAYGQAAAQDLESKFSEGALGNTQLADYRNFAHGRHNWFTQRPGQTAVICFITPQDKEMVELTLSFLPKHIPIIRVESSFKTPLATIDLLIKEYYLCHILAERWGLEIGNPQVPLYGIELYNL